MDGVTGVGVYVNGGLDVSVPSVIGFWVSPASPSVVRATDPANDWLRLTLKLPTLAVVARGGQRDRRRRVHLEVGDLHRQAGVHGDEDRVARAEPVVQGVDGRTRRVAVEQPDLVHRVGRRRRAS